jgi:hypothetical protein
MFQVLPVRSSKYCATIPVDEEKMMLDFFLVLAQCLCVATQKFGVLAKLSSAISRNSEVSNLISTDFLR